MKLYLKNGDFELSAFKAALKEPYIKFSKGIAKIVLR